MPNFGIGGGDSQKLTQTTVNRNVALNAGGIGASTGKVGGQLSVGGGVATGDIKGDANISITDADPEVLHHALDYAQDVTQDALFRNSEITLASQNILSHANDNATALAVASVNAAQQSTINALALVQQGQQKFGELTQSAIDSAQNIAANAAPVSPGSYALATAGQNTKIFALTLVGVGIAAYLYFKNK